MSVQISAGNVLDAVTTGQTSIFIPAAHVRALALKQKPVVAPFGAFTVRVVDVRLGKGKFITQVECSGDATSMLALIPLPQVKAALVANQALGKPVAVEPSFVVETALKPYLVADTKELFAPVADFTVVNFKPLNGLPLGVGNLVTGFLGSVAGTTFSVAGSAASGIGSIASSAGSAAGQAASTVTKPIRNAASVVGNKLSGFVPARFKRKEKVVEEKAVEEEVVVAPATPEITAVVEDGMDKDEVGRFASYIQKLLNYYLEKRPVLVLPDEYEGVSIAGLVRRIEIEQEGIRVFVDVNENPTFRSYRNWAIGGIGSVAVVAIEWIATGSFLWF